MLQKMNRVLVIGPRQVSQNVVDTLYHAGTLHLEDVSDNVPAFAFRLRKWEMEAGEEISRLLVKIGGILNTLPEVVENGERQEYRRDEVYWQNQEELITRTNHVISELERTTKDFVERRNDLEFSLTALARYEKTIEKIQPLEGQLPLLEGFEVSVLIIQKEFEDVIALIEDELVRITHNQFEIVSAEIDDVTLAAIIVFHRRHSREVHNFIFSKNVNEVRLPDEYMGKPFDEVLPLIREKKLEIEDELDTIKDSLVNMAGAWYQELVILNSVLEDKSKEFAAFEHFGSTEYTFMVTGWIPRIYLEKTKNILHEKFGEKVVLTELDVTEEDTEKTPTLYANPRIVKPFEFFMKLMSPPNYREIDPSPILAFFFPVFFGLMVGDIGYGLVILGIALLAKKLFGELEWVKSLANIMIISSIPAIFFGFLYGEFFGDFGEIMGWIHPVHLLGIELNRIEAILPLLIFTIGVGVIHVFLGLGLGVFNAYSHHNRKHMAEKIGMLGALTGLIMMGGAAAAFLPAITISIGIGLFIIALILILYGGGAMGVLEIMGTVGNILSYARLMAIGMASVILAVVANTLGGALGVVLVGIVVAVLLHSLNIILAMFSPSLHSIRLHMVECYSKFYEGGGTMYAPFKREEKI